MWQLIPGKAAFSSRDRRTGVRGYPQLPGEFKANQSFQGLIKTSKRQKLGHKVTNTQTASILQNVTFRGVIQEGALGMLSCGGPWVGLQSGTYVRRRNKRGQGAQLQLLILVSYKVGGRLDRAAWLACLLCAQKQKTGILAVRSPSLSWPPGSSASWSDNHTSC